MLRPKIEIHGVPRVLPGAPAILPENRHELWTLNPKGDWEIAYFDLPDPQFKNAKHVAKAAKKTWAKWVSMQAWPVRGEKYATTEPRVLGPFVIPQAENLDYRRYVLVARWKQRRPKLISLDEASQISETEVPANFMSLFIESMRRLTGRPWDEVVAMAGQNAGMHAVALAEAKLWEELEWIRRHKPNANDGH